MSVAVRHQYEENPFPRWGKCEPPGWPLTVDQFLREQIPAGTIPQSWQGERRHPDCRLRYRPAGDRNRATISAVAPARGRPEPEQPCLCKAPHARARSRTHRLCPGRHSQTRFGPADIRRHRDERRLHHLADPFAGWRVLLSLLRPGGFMAIGLYSELARGHIAAARSFIAERGYPPTAEAIRLCRQELMGLAAPHRSRRWCDPRTFSAPANAATCSFMSRSTASRCRRSPAFLPTTVSHSWDSILGERERAKYRAPPRSTYDRSRPLAHVREREPRYLHEHVSILGAGGGIVGAERSDMRVRPPHHDAQARLPLDLSGGLQLVNLCALAGRGGRQQCGRRCRPGRGSQMAKATRLASISVDAPLKLRDDVGLAF